jgi:hypothetical protein
MHHRTEFPAYRGRMEYACLGCGARYPHDSLLYALNREITEKKLSIKKQKNDINIIQITFINHDELFAKLYTEQLIDIATEFYIQIKTQNLKANLAILKTQADSVRKEYEKAISAQAKYFDQNTGPSKNTVMVEPRKIHTTIQLTGATYAEMAKNIEIMKLDLIRQTPLIQIIDAPVMPLETQRFGKIQGITFGGFTGACLSITILLAIYLYRRIIS